jgi:hypothetical protein
MTLVCRAEGLCLGIDRQHLSREHRRPVGRADDSPVVGRDFAHSVLHHCARHRSDLRGWRAYTVHNALLDAVLMLVFGIVGDVFMKLDYPLTPLVLALVSGDMAEASFRQSMLISQGSMKIFYSNPLVGTIVTLALLMLFWPLLNQVKAVLRARENNLA